MRKWLVVLAVVAVLLIGGAVVVISNLNACLGHNREWIAEQAEAAVGRTVAFEDVGVSLSAGLGVGIEGLRVADDPVLCQNPANPKLARFRGLTGWHRSRSRPTSDILADVGSAP